MSKLNISCSFPALRAFGLLGLVGLTTASGTAQAGTASVTTASAYGYTTSTGSTQTFIDPTPVGAHISSIKVSTEVRPGWLSTRHVGLQMYLLEGTYIVDTAVWGGSIYTPVSDTYSVCDEGLWGTPVLAFVKDGVNSLKVQGFWNYGTVAPVTLEFTYQMDGPDLDCDGVADVATDTDGDGVVDDEDNCPADANASQVDTDLDGEGDACDLDDDGDGVVDVDDNCPVIHNSDQSDFDGDGDGDACDADADADGVLDADEPALCLETPFDALVGADGCSGAQYVEVECGTCADHDITGGYVSCVALATNEAKAAGLLTGREKSIIVSEAARSCR